MASDPHMKRDAVEWPSGVVLARQLGIVIVVLLAWGTAFTFAMNLPTGTADDLAAAERRAARRTAAQTGAQPGAQSGAQSGAQTDAQSSARTGAPSPGASNDSIPAVSAAAGSAIAASVSRTDSATEIGTPGDRPASIPSTVAADVADPEDPITVLAREDRAPLVPDVSGHPPVSFAQDVYPILLDRCISCHGGARDDGSLRIEEGLDLRTVDAILAGSTWGSVVEPGDPVASYLLEMVLDGDMPDEGPRLLPGQIRTLTAWIAQGAGG